MASPHLVLSPEQLSAAFPFHVAFDGDFRIVQAGPVLHRLCPDLTCGSPLEQFFEVKRPRLSSLEAISAHTESLFILEHLNSRMLLRGQMLPDEGQGATIFLCTPWLKDLTTAETLGLSLEDFAIHDPVADFLFLLQAKDTALADSNKLATTLRLQRKALRKAQAALEDQITERSAALELANREIKDRQQAEQALERSLERERKRALHDPLTGVLNHAGIVEQLAGLVAESGNEDSHAIAMVDVDGLKTVNDMYGHLMGDAILIAAARELSRFGAVVGR